ncbi:MAG TPA: hypothetical protein VMU90_01040, partial [Solirubrobacteraceae bacterium]|nr:hypothetical protein [Solirubrobacteraceae bacterium]
MPLRHSASDWSVVAEILAPERYESRLDRVMEAVGRATGHPLSSLYLPDASGRRLRLERTRGQAPERAQEEDVMGAGEAELMGG